MRARKSHGQVSRASDSRPCDAEPKAGTGKVPAVHQYAVLGSPDSGCVPDPHRHIFVAAARCPLSRVRTRRACPAFIVSPLTGCRSPRSPARCRGWDSGRRVGRGKAWAAVAITMGAHQHYRAGEERVSCIFLVCQLSIWLLCPPKRKPLRKEGKKPRGGAFVRER